jgi:hypothetical protein
MASDGHAWIAVFFLFMNQSLSLDQVIQLSAVYYFSAFLLEVPSGYFSDRIGRRITLLISASALIGSYSCFILGSGFEWYACGQFLLAAGIAMQSGTDTAFHYDSLKAVGQEHEYEQREATAEQWGLIFLAIATFSGGALGMIDLRLAYGFSLLSAIGMFLLVWRFVEPTHSSEHSVVADSFVTVVLACFARLRDPLLGWLFAASIILYALAHIVFELYQPYIGLLKISFLDAAEYAPLISGIIISISMFGGALGAKFSIRLNSKLGLLGLMALACAIQLGIVAAMSIIVSPLFLVFVFARNFPMAMVHAPVRAAIAPRISRDQRATYLSLQGLSERIFFAMLLLTLAAELEPGVPVDQPTLLGILSSTLWIGVGLLVILFLFSNAIMRIINESKADKIDSTESGLRDIP